MAQISPPASPPADRSYGNRIRNLILLGLPPRERVAVIKKLEFVELRRTRIRGFRQTLFFLGALLAVILTMPAGAMGHEPQASGTQDEQLPSAQQTATEQPASNQSQQNSSQPGLTEKEQQNVQHENETGISKDRIFWTMPNFLTMENADNIPPLTAGQKFKVVGRSLIDPSEFVLIGFVAGLGQASDSNPTFGQGAQGYAKRYGTSYADNAVENFMASAVLPSLLHQDPRYYQLGHGSFVQRAGHALARVVITRTDSGKEQFNYSEVFGAGIAATISTYTYHPESERSFGNVASVWSTQIGWDVVTYMIKEFWPDLRKKHHK
jgi:hypothetical protein